MKKKNAVDIGVSAYFIFVRNNTIFSVQFGRLVAGLLNKETFRELGKSWENFHVKSRKELFLLGGVEENIFIDFYKTELDKDEQFFVIPISVARELKKENLEYKIFARDIQDNYQENHFPHVILQGKDKNPNKSTNLFKKIFKK